MTTQRKFWIGSALLTSVALGMLAMAKAPEAIAQRPAAAAPWEYKVSVFSYNPGERLTDEKRAAIFEQALNAQARQGWEPVGSLMSRDTVQTVGGGVTTRDTTSFVAYRRAKR